MGISGFTIARNVIKLGYPATQAIQSFRPICDELILSYDPWSDDGTEAWAKELAQELDLRLFESKWEVTDTGQMRFDKERGCNEVAIQAAKAAEQCRYEWNLYVEADEGFHEKDHDDIRNIPRQFASTFDITGVDFKRVCFYKDLQTIRVDWSTSCTRMVRKGTHDYYVPGGSMSSAAIKGRHAKANIGLFHYVRIGDPLTIARRIRNLDTFYHDPATLVPTDQLEPYDFKPREFDNYSTVPEQRPKDVEGQFRKYTGPHPGPFVELYKNGV